MLSFSPLTLGKKADKCVFQNAELLFYAKPNSRLNSKITHLHLNSPVKTQV